MRSLRLLLLSALAIPQVLWAAPTVSVPIIRVCNTLLNIPCVDDGILSGVAIINVYFLDLVYDIFIGLALLFFFYYAIRLITESEDANTITETKSAYTYAITGCILVAISKYIAEAVVPGLADDSGSLTSENLINPTPVDSAVNILITFFRLFVSAAVTGTIVYQGFRLILLQGKESEMEQSKKRFFQGLLGVAVILLADAIVSAFFPSQNGPTGLVAELVGIVNFLLTIFGALAVLSFIISGLMIVFSVNDSLKDRAKKAMFTTVICLILVLVTYVIINLTFAIADPEGTERQKVSSLLIV